MCYSLFLFPLDGMLFGRIPPCPNCKDTLHFSGGKLSVAYCVFHVNASLSADASLSLSLLILTHVNTHTHAHTHTRTYILDVAVQASTSAMVTCPRGVHALTRQLR